MSYICVLEIYKVYEQREEENSFQFIGRVRSKYYSAGITRLDWWWGKELLLGKSLSWFSSVLPLVWVLKELKSMSPILWQLLSCYLLDNIDEWLKHAKLDCI